jgi:hypothetical protein
MSAKAKAALLSFIPNAAFNGVRRPPTRDRFEAIRPQVESLLAREKEH